MKGSVSRDGSQINITVTVRCGSAGLYDIPLTHNCNGKVEAGFLHEQIRDSIARQIESIREQAYNKGWSDKSSKKRAKQKWFSGCFNNIDCQ